MINITFLSQDKTAETFVLIFSGSPLPFPFSLTYPYRILIAVLMILILLCGSYFRMVIIKYLCKPKNKLGPINLLIWVDQTNGVFLAVNTLGRIMAFIAPFPLSKITGDKFCPWTPLPGELLVFFLTGCLLPCTHCLFSHYAQVKIRYQIFGHNI